jgi:hypothetical protein
MTLNIPQGSGGVVKCDPFLEEKEFTTNIFPQSGLVDILTRVESIQLAFYTPNDTLIRSESIQLAFYTPNDTLIRSESIQLAFYTPNDTLIRSESTLVVNI